MFASELSGGLAPTNSSVGAGLLSTQERRSALTDGEPPLTRTRRDLREQEKQ